MHESPHVREVSNLRTVTTLFHIGEQGEERLQNVRYRMAEALHQSLDLQTMLETFLDQLKTLMAVDGLDFHNPLQGIRVSVGQGGLHSSSYRLRTDTDILGTLVLRRRARFTARECGQLDTLMKYLLNPLRNALRFREALQQAWTDALTGVGNRMAMNVSLENAIRQSIRYQSPLSLLLTDIDYFKKINDMHGHLAGDHVLRQVADAIKVTCRAVDNVFRYGGEEFMVLLPNTDRPGASVIAERVRRVVKNLMIAVDNRPIPVTLSAGVSFLRDDDSMETLLKRADDCLYIAKRNGRDQVIVEKDSSQELAAL